MQLGNTHVHHVDVTFDLLDPGNLLYHPRYLVLADRARGSMLEALGCPVHELWTEGHALVVAELSSRFIIPVLGGAKLAILTQMLQRSAKTLQVTQRFVIGEQLARTLPDGSFVEGPLPAGAHIVCEMEARLVCANVVQRCVAAVPEKLAHALHATVKDTNAPAAYAGAAA